MSSRTTSKTTLLWMIILAIGLNGACSPAKKLAFPSEKAVVAIQGEMYPVDPLFVDFYQFLGGIEVLGPAISPLIESGNTKSQYVEAARMMYDPQAVESERFQLAPLGVNLGYAEPAVPPPASPEVRYVNGHVIHKEFVPFYDKLGGAQFVGRPLTEVNYNFEKRRIEQHFENLGFYRWDGDLPGAVHLIAYGAKSCDWICNHKPPEGSEVSLFPLLPEPFASEVARRGYTFLGRTLSEPYLTPDGRLEVIFENAVLTVEPTQSRAKSANFFWFWLPLLLAKQLEAPHAGEMDLYQLHLPLVLGEEIRREITLSFQLWLPMMIFGDGALSRQLAQAEVTARPIVEMVGIPTQLPVKQRIDQLMTFYTAGGDKGYHIPIYFADYIERHGGLDFVGPPIGEISPLGEGVFRQCFTNMCLNFDINAPPDQNLKPAPLGVVYKELYYNQQDKTRATQTPDNIQLRVEEIMSYVSPTESQVFGITLMDQDGPLVGRQAELTITLPTNVPQKITFPPTDEGGRSQLVIAPIAAPIGTIIEYSVCALGVSAVPVCVQDRYMIWEP